MTERIETLPALEAVVGKVPGPRDLKVIDFLDAASLRWLQTSPLLFAAFGDGRGIAITVGGGEPGFVQAPDARRLRISLALLDHPDQAQPGLGFGGLFLSPSLCETLRVNGRVVSVAEGVVEIEVRECYLHCAKALIRSEFWKGEPGGEIPDTATAFVDASRFMALATINEQGQADVSPKGDPRGAMLQMRSGDAWFADRPGNRRVDSFRNILAQPRVAAAVLVPGSSRMVLLSGTACLTTDAAMRALFTVAERLPKLATCIEQPLLQAYDSAALARAQPWPALPAAADIDPAAIFKAHVMHSKSGGIMAGIARTALAVPGFMDKTLQNDYKKNLY
ncbi:pyridoxamine 5'-phosphate oxidase family protein [Solimonas sp. SE-A11]|uniref:pyridoxamine 5'-phosphate oxidase family protein n=1 Tax=Solimonas sp. SE-A11 TaxID=3054954 RepID=UPI00259CA671|nr:pyridoxamine 5'-phosphate oxidase family protein [Solimonas sp. SE-A11]MDM4772710.1 pyridoxamine 5'-phosphate oxidase family protein [Solimonas sp. SE-A11]